MMSWLAATLVWWYVFSAIKTHLSLSGSVGFQTRLLAVRRMATNLENLEYSGISLNVENSGNSVQPQRKIVTN